jgi:hypothetical protein
MKRPPAPRNADQLAEILRRSQLFSEDEIRSILDRWQRDAGDTADSARFARWLAARGYLNEQQANQLFLSNAAPVMRAALVAPAASPRPDRSAIPTATAARPEPPAPPSEPDVDVELVDPNLATLPLNVAAPPLNFDLEPAAAAPVVLPEPPPPVADQGITVELVALAEKPAPVFAPPANAHASGIVDWTNVSLYLFLGALGLLIVEFAGWVLAHLAAWLTT